MSNGSKEEECGQKAQAVVPEGCELMAILKTFGLPETKKAYKKAGPNLKDDVIGFYERIVEDISLVLSTMTAQGNSLLTRLQTSEHDN